MSSPQPSSSLMSQGLRGRFLLVPVERRVSGYSLEQSQAVRELFDAAVMRHESARDTMDRDNVPLGIELARSAAELYARAALVAHAAPALVARWTTEEVWS